MFESYLNWRFLVVIIAILIVSATIWFSNKLAHHLADEERKKMQVYALATESLANMNAEFDMNLASTIINQNSTIPAIITDENDKIISSVNITLKKNKSLQDYLKQFKNENKPIIANINGNSKNFVYYGNSYLLRQLKYFPYILFGVIAVFISILFIAIDSANKAMQNKVWVGMSKETAHQLGTPITSMMGWIELLKAQEQQAIAEDMEKDVNRLKLITDRFSKIGSIPELNEENIIDHIREMVNYMKKRSAQKIEINFNDSNIHDLPILMNGPLFDWVIENLIRNAIDAMNGEGKINIDIENKNAEFIIDISDNGKGIEKSHIKKIFKPGFTTKKRGWGLGLSLTKRIIEKYHKGRIMVLKSEVNKGTTFRIIMKKGA